MKIVKLTLVGYKRLLLNNIKEFTYTPNSPYQIILGRNGSGKSSLLAELSPLPGVPANYIKGGSKTIEIEHRNSHYVLSSVFSGSGGKHSFLKDGEELNPGGTAAIQREMVRREFNYSPEIHALLIGEERFTTMTPARRREWITSLSDTDLTYAVKIYNVLRGKARDAIGALRHVNNRLASETNKLMSIEDAKELESRVKEISDELTVLMENRVPNLPAYHPTLDSLERNMRRIQECAHEILSLVSPRPRGFSFQNDEQLLQSLNEIRAKISVAESLLKRATDDHGEMEKLLETIQTYSAGSIEDLKRRQGELEKQVAELEKSIERFRIENAEEKVADSAEALPVLVEILTEIKDNSDKRYNRADLQKAKQASETLRNEIDRRKNLIRQCLERIDHIKNARETNCPKCGYTWKEGVSEGQLEKLEALIAEHSKQQEELEKELEKHNQYIEEAEEWAAQYRRFSQLAAHYPRLRQLWDDFLENERLVVNPSGQFHVLTTWERDLATCRQLEQVKQELERLSLALKSADSSSDTQHLQERFMRLEDEIGARTTELVELRRQQNELEVYSKKVMRMIELNYEMRTLIKTVEEQYDTLVSVLRNQEINQAIQANQSTLAHLQHRLNEKSNLENILKDLQKSADALSVDSKALDLLVECLSPHDGLIAEQLTSFIVFLVEQMNEIIEQIWTYDLFVLPCGVESGELDYRFPLQVRTKDNQVPDVSKASDGQMEIIDFAFKVVAMIYLNLEGYPLYLDELGRACDEQHRANIVNYLKRLMDARRHQQLFYISHFAFSYGAMAGSEVLVLDSANITVPANHNKHVTMT